MKNSLYIACLSIFLFGFTSYGKINVEAKNISVSENTFYCVCKGFSAFGFENQSKMGESEDSCLISHFFDKDDLYLSMYHVSDSEMMISLFYDRRKDFIRITFEEIHLDGFTSRSDSHIKNLNSVLLKYNLPTIIKKN